LTRMIYTGFCGIPSFLWSGMREQTFILTIDCTYVDKVEDLPQENESDTLPVQTFETWIQYLIRSLRNATFYLHIEASFSDSSGVYLFSIFYKYYIQ